jgi:hypothetical protein
MNMSFNAFWVSIECCYCSMPLVMQHLKCNREERDKLLDECSDSRMLLLEQVEATKANTQTVLNDAFTMLEQVQNAILDLLSYC